MLWSKSEEIYDFKNYEIICKNGKKLKKKEDHTC